MRGHVLTRYIVRNRLNLEAFFEPIIDFIEIGNPKLGITPPPRTVYENFISYSSNKKTPILYWFKRIWNRKFETFKSSNSILSEDRKGSKSERPSCGYNAKKSSRLVHLYVDH